MKQRYLEVTYRHGKPLAAYLYLPRAPGAKVVRTMDEGRGLRSDFDANGELIGIEITAPSAVSTEDINALLVRLHHVELSGDDLAPLRAA